jgi:hypothetical protein
MRLRDEREVARENCWHSLALPLLCSTGRASQHGGYGRSGVSAWEGSLRSTMEGRPMDTPEDWYLGRSASNLGCPSYA